MPKLNHFLSFGVILAILMAFCSGTAPAQAAAIEAEAAAQELHQLGLFGGTGTRADGAPEFELDRALTRNEAVTMLVRLLGKESEALAATYQLPFSDVPNWAKPYVGYAYHHGLANGMGDGKFGGADSISAAQYLTFVLRTLGYSDAVDFRWDRAWELSDRLGITCGQYRAGTAFTRGDAAIISRNALSAHLKASTTTLLDAYHSHPQPSQPAQEAPQQPLNSSFEVHFIDVGQADAALVLCDGHAMLIDGGNAADSSLIYSYLKSHGISYLDYIVCTHPHEDHVGGLAGALNYAQVGIAYCPVTSYDSSAFESFAKYLSQQGKHIAVPKAGDAFSLGGAAVEVIGPITDSGDMNNRSIVLRVIYGETSFLFTGDAEREEEQDILNAGYDLSSTVLKVGHHGSDSSTTYPFLREIMPQYAVISVGQGNSYGHPTDHTLSRLRDADVKVYRTDMQGHIICKSDGKAVLFSVERNVGADTLGNPGSKQGSTGDSQGSANKQQSAPAQAPSPSQSGSYVLNTNTRVFHRVDCSSVGKMSEQNRVSFHGTREDALAQGYTPCGACHP